MTCGRYHGCRIKLPLKCQPIHRVKIPRNETNDVIASRYTCVILFRAKILISNDVLECPVKVFVSVNLYGCGGEQDVSSPNLEVP